MARTGTSTGGPLMVGVSGLRGIVGGSLTPDVVARYAGAWASMVQSAGAMGNGGEGPDAATPHLSTKTPTSSPPRGEAGRADARGAEVGAGGVTMVVGRDGRRGGEEIERIVVEALARAGCDVVRLGVAMTPTVGVAVRARSAKGQRAAGLVVTASHNPEEWNGLKPITPEGSAPMPAVARELVARFERGEVARSATPGRIEEDRGATEYHVRRVIEEIGRIANIDEIRKNRYRVVLDSVNASGSVGAKMLLAELGCAVTPLYCDESGVFPHTPEPIAENVRDLCGVVRSAHAEIGFAQDPDADRLAIVNRNGIYIGEEFTLVLGAIEVLEGEGIKGSRDRGIKGGGLTVAANLSTSRMIDDVAALYGAKVVRTAVGEASVVDGMRRSGAVIGGEGNGGVIWPAVGEIRDSIAAMALVLALKARRGEPIATIVEGLPKYAIVKRKMPFEAGMDERILKRLRGLFPGATVDEQDGIRMDFAAPSGKGRAWVHARKSSTEPIFRLIAEAESVEDADAILDRVQGGS